MILGLMTELLVAAMLAAAPGETPEAGSAETVAEIAPPGGALATSGVSLHRPYEAGKVPVLLVHGLWSVPEIWEPLINALEADETLSGKCQFWTYGYSTGDPLPYSASVFRNTFRQAREQLDPNHADKAFDRVVVVGHSQGGLLTKMIAQRSGDACWRSIANRPFEEVKGPESSIAMIRQCAFYDPLPEVRRLVYIATPHRGSDLDRGRIHRLGTQIIRLPDPLLSAYQAMIQSNPPDFFAPYFRAKLPTSVDELAWDGPMLTAIGRAEVRPQIPFHSIIARKPGKETDGLVPFASAHLDGSASELVVSGGHYCVSDPAVISEVGRILKEHAGP